MKAVLLLAFVTLVSDSHSIGLRIHADSDSLQIRADSDVPSDNCAPGAPVNFEEEFCEVIVADGSVNQHGEPLYTVWFSIDSNSTTSRCADFPSYDIGFLEEYFPEAAEGTPPAIIKNGPRVWVTHCAGSQPQQRATVETAPETRQVGGILFERRAEVVLSEDEQYQANFVNRSAIVVWAKGDRVYELIDSDGSSYFMQSFSTQFRTDQTVESLSNLDEILLLPDDWKFQTRVLEQDVVVLGVHGVVNVIEDDFYNTYSMLDGQT